MMDDNIEESKYIPPQKLSPSISGSSCNFEEMIKVEKLDAETPSCSFTSEDLANSDDICIIDVPKIKVEREIITLDDESEFQIKNEQYCIKSRDTDSNITCVLSTKKKDPKYKIVKKKLLKRKTEPISIENIENIENSVPVPDNSIIRSPKVISVKRKSLIDEIAQMDDNIEESKYISPQKLSPSIPGPSGPRTIEELIQMEKLVPETLPSTLTLEDLEDLSDDVEIWIMNVPASIDPQELEEQIITFGGETEFKIQDKQYSCIESRDTSDVTCVLRTGKDTQEYKTVNMKPKGTLTVRRKLSEIIKGKPIPVPMPNNLKRISNMNLKLKKRR